MKLTKDTTDAVQLRILAFMERNGLSIEQMGERAEVAEGAIRDIRKPTWRPTFTTVKKLEAVIPSSFSTPSTYVAPWLRRDVARVQSPHDCAA
ncbi:helix-turn-helix domain-containing protein [Azospirillum sp.]|uniref:helix-turn-helix domain-containing protein n=1 Tax=Azospirillum sp. TaxID=34012 RepID=UPI003D75C747